jgi:hypothetical protein
MRSVGHAVRFKMQRNHPQVMDGLIDIWFPDWFTKCRIWNEPSFWHIYERY